MMIKKRKCNKFVISREKKRKIKKLNSCLTKTPFEKFSKKQLLNNDDKFLYKMKSGMEKYLSISTFRVSKILN